MDIFISEQSYLVRIDGRVVEYEWLDYHISEENSLKANPMPCGNNEFRVGSPDGDSKKFRIWSVWDRDLRDKLIAYSAINMAGYNWKDFPVNKESLQKIKEILWKTEEEILDVDSRTISPESDYDHWACVGILKWMEYAREVYEALIKSEGGAA